uniref:THD domain-containing protein n=1 Tax=Stomoxys calcitrans TaxID=35570 RepID=A0A1I8PRE1_STOCA
MPVIMTAETLKPFITPPGSVDYVTTSHSSASSVHHRGSRYLIVIVASAFLVLLVSSLLGHAIWNTVRISHLNTEVESLNNIIESMQKRLGLEYLDGLIDIEKEDENNNALIDDMLLDEEESNSGEENDEDGDEDDDDDEEDDEGDDDTDDFDYDEIMKKFIDFEKEDDDADADDDDSEEYDNLYEDYEKYQGSTKKTQPGERKTRSIQTPIKEDDTLNDKESLEQQVTRTPSLRKSLSKPTLVAADNADRRRSPLRPSYSRRRKFPAVKSAKTVAQEIGFNEVETTKPAAHFHLTHKIPNHHATVRVNSYNGDMYIGRPSWTNERDSLDSFFHVENGVLTVHESGLYYVYAQICYHNPYPQNGFIIFHGHKPFLQCLSNIFTNNNSVINTCHTSGLIYLKRDEHIHIRDFHSDRKAYLEDGNNRSYFGLIKI